MRTTLTIEDQLSRELRAEAKRSGLPMKQLVNRALRAGLANLGQPKARPYRCPVFSMGAPGGRIDLDKALALAATIEDDEIARKLELRK